MTELTPHELLRAVLRAEEQSAVAAEFAEQGSSPVDRAFLGHLVAAHGVDRESALERDVNLWREFHRMMPHHDHSHGWPEPD